MTAASSTHDRRVPLLLLISFTTGLVDAASVLGLDRVFTANMTGNVVFLGFAAAGAPGFDPAPLIVAIASFMTGALVGGRVGRVMARKSQPRWLLISAAFETALLWTAAAASLSFDVARQAPAEGLFAIIVLTGLAMGYRNATTRQLKIPDLTTTVLTQTLTGLGADSSLAGGANDNWRRRLGAVAAILAGAAAGAWLLIQSSLALPLALAGALILFGTTVCSNAFDRPER